MRQELVPADELMLLACIHRHPDGGIQPPPLTSRSFASAYWRLVEGGLIEYSSGRDSWVVTDDGTHVLKEHFLAG